MNKTISFSILITLCIQSIGQSAEYRPALPVSGYTLVWADEFAGPSLDQTKWAYRQLGPRRDAVNVKETVTLDGKGHLVLTTRHHQDQIETAMIGTQGQYEPTYGYFECRVKLQRQIGHWSAFWLQTPTMGQEIDNPGVSGTEIDIFEYLRKQGDIIQHTLHWDGYGEHHQSAAKKPHIPGLSEGWHTFGLLWTEQEYVFYVDGQTTWRTNQGISHRSEYLILSLEVGQWAGDIKAATLPDSMLVDYVRVYQKQDTDPSQTDPLPTTTFPEFTYHTIDKIGNKMGQTDLVDMDRDGDLDWVVGEAPWGQSRLWWWEYQGPDHWIRHMIGKADTDVGGDCHDVNGDGWVDFWGGKVLFLNQGQGVFTRHEVGTTFSHDSQFVEINGDGRIDGIANWDKYGLVWYEIPQDPTQSWTEHMIQPSAKHTIHGGVSPHPVGDIDGDGDQDVVTGQAWYENLDGKGLHWQGHPNINFGEQHQYGIALKTWILDMDGDRDIDVVQAEADNPDGRIAWLENDGQGNWTRHLIKDKGDQQDFHSLVVADFDNDGDSDVFAGGGPLSGGAHKAYIWENTTPPHTRPTSNHWIEHIVAEKPCHEAVGADVDGDGDIDICTKPWSTGNEHYYLQNTMH